MSLPTQYRLYGRRQLPFITAYDSLPSPGEQRRVKSVAELGYRLWWLSPEMRGHRESNVTSTATSKCVSKAQPTQVVLPLNDLSECLNSSQVVLCQMANCSRADLVMPQRMFCRPKNLCVRPSGPTTSAVVSADPRHSWRLGGLTQPGSLVPCRQDII